MKCLAIGCVENSRRDQPFCTRCYTLLNQKHRRNTDWKHRTPELVKEAINWLAPMAASQNKEYIDLMVEQFFDEVIKKEQTKKLYDRKRKDNALIVQAHTNLRESDGTKKLDRH